MADPIFKELAFATLAQTARNPTQDFIRATPRNPILGYLSDLAASSYSPQRTQQMQGVAKFFGAPAISQTLDRLSYGEPLITGAGGLGGTTRVRPEAIEAAMAVAPMVGPAARMTKGLPVGMSIKSIDELAAKYPGVKIDAFVTKDNLNLSRIVVPKEMRNQGIGTQVMTDLSEYADNIGKRITLTPSSDFGGNVKRLKEFYKDFGFVENKGKNKDFSTSETMYREPKPIDQTTKSFQAPQDEALRLAQQRAALPVEQGGLGLAASNTPAERAAAMGFEKDVFHGTNTLDIEKIDPTKARESVQYMPGFFTAENPQLAQNFGEFVMPMMQKKGITVLDKRRARIAGEDLPIVDTVYDKTKGILVTNNPDNVRSRFAAFDPFRKTAATAATMGVAAPDLLAQEQPNVSEAQQRAIIMRDLGIGPYTIYEQTGVWLGGNE
jgi:GNAT superfamily N-acetyltransferase